jgi:hypothetical protein
MTIKQLADKFKEQSNTPLSDDDCELFKIFLEDDYNKLAKLTGKTYAHFQRVLFSIEMLKYDDGKGMKNAYYDAVLSIGALLKWCDGVVNESKNRICI